MYIGVIELFMNNYVLIIYKVSVVFYLIYLSIVSCKVCEKTIWVLITINALSQYFKIWIFAAIVRSSPMEHLGKQTTNCHEIYILLFPKSFAKIQVPFKSDKKMTQFMWKHICIYYNISSIFLVQEIFEAQFVQH